MNGYNDFHPEPADDEEFAIACGYEIINADELYDIISISCSRRSSSDEVPSPAPGSGGARPSFWQRSGMKKLTSKPSVSSFTSTTTQSSGVSSMLMGNPMSSCSLFSHGTDADMSEEDDCFSDHHDMDHQDDDDDDAHHDYQMSVERIWSMIQQKRHHHHHDDMDEGIRMADDHHHHHILTMEQGSNGKKLTAWFHNLVHFPERIRQIVANKHRFNIEKAPEEIRDELKHIYVY